MHTFISNLLLGLKLATAFVNGRTIVMLGGVRKELRNVFLKMCMGEDYLT